MTIKKSTDDKDVKAFEEFVNEMGTAEYNFYLDNEATDAQKELAKKIRHDTSEEDAEGQFP